MEYYQIIANRIASLCKERNFSINMLAKMSNMRQSTIDDWNNIEKALVEADSVFPNYFAWNSGEISCGEF